MKEEKEFHKRIQNTGKERRKAILEDIHKEIDDDYLRAPSVPPVKTSKKRRNISIAIGVASCVVVIVLCVVFIPKRESDNKRYCTFVDYIRTTSDTTIAVYNQENNTNFLYFNWYNNAEYVSDTLFLDKKDGRLLCIMEEIIDGDTGQSVIISATKLNIYIDVLDTYTNLCKDAYRENEYSFLWSKNLDIYYCIFEWRDYRYYLEISDVPDLEALAGIIDSLKTE